MKDAAPAVHFIMDKMLRGEFKIEETIKVTNENVDYNFRPNLEKVDSENAIKKFCANNNKFMEDR